MFQMRLLSQILVIMLETVKKIFLPAKNENDIMIIKKRKTGEYT